LQHLPDLFGLGARLLEQAGLAELHEHLLGPLGNQRTTGPDEHVTLLDHRRGQVGQFDSTRPKMI